MDFYKKLFQKEINAEMVLSEILDLVDEDTLYEFIIGWFNDNINDVEMVKILHEEGCGVQEIIDILTELGHDVRHLTCKGCGYKQGNGETVISYMIKNPNEEPYDIQYLCNVCKEIEKKGTN